MSNMRNSAMTSNTTTKNKGNATETLTEENPVSSTKENMMGKKAAKRVLNDPILCSPDLATKLLKRTEQKSIIEARTALEDSTDASETLKFIDDEETARRYLRDPIMCPADLAPGLFKRTEHKSIIEMRVTYEDDPPEENEDANLKKYRRHAVIKNFDLSKDEPEKPVPDDDEGSSSGSSTDTWERNEEEEDVSELNLHSVIKTFEPSKDEPEKPVPDDDEGSSSGSSQEPPGENEEEKKLMKPTKHKSIIEVHNTTALKNSTDSSETIKFNDDEETARRVPTEPILVPIDLATRLFKRTEHKSIIEMRVTYEDDPPEENEDANLQKYRRHAVIKKFDLSKDEPEKPVPDDDEGSNSGSSTDTWERNEEEEDVSELNLHSVIKTFEPSKDETEKPVPDDEEGSNTGSSTDTWEGNEEEEDIPELNLHSVIKTMEPSKNETEKPVPINDGKSSSSGNSKEFNASQTDPTKLNAEEEARDKVNRLNCSTFLQHLPCFKLQQPSCEDKSAAPIIPNCRECVRRNINPQTSSNEFNCRFYEFRLLQYNIKGELRVAGFTNPYTEPMREDLNIWLPDENTEPTAGYMDIQVCRYILLHVGDQFCYLWQQETEALRLHENPNTTIAWKKSIKGIREICDVCDTTLFNYHWTCNKCGFSVCLDCFKDRKEGRSVSKKPKDGRDIYRWLRCTYTWPKLNSHRLRDLMLTQIIAGNSLNLLGRLLHEVCANWQVPQNCDCLLRKSNLDNVDRTKIAQVMIKESQLKPQTSDSSLATDEPKTQYKDPITSAFDNLREIDFQQKGLAGLRRFIPSSSMTLPLSTQLAPGVPHEWLCNGKLLRLTDAKNPDNRVLYQEMWKRGQPIMISDVARSLNLDLWSPEAFCKDFGDKFNDLINCFNGKVVSNLPMRYFWNGFQYTYKRPLDASRRPMLLKLKDWPPSDDFAEILPTRYADFMKGLPMPEYTLRTGHLNIASCLPKMFVPPDLGPKMYNAYGSVLYPTKGTTNLHLDVSDAVNVMVYVGLSQDEDIKRQLVGTQRAIAMSGCDDLTRKRCELPNVIPGAMWHIFEAKDAVKIRAMLNRIAIEKGNRLAPDHDPIHDQNWYLDKKLRQRLLTEYGVTSYPIVQCLGDAVFIPAGAPHQVQNLHNCIKIAEDFVSPENITHCCHLAQEFRQLSHLHANREDKLQIKNIVYHAVKDCCTILKRALDQRLKAEKKKDLEVKIPKDTNAADEPELMQT